MLIYATESVDFQGDGFFKALVAVITRLKIDDDYTTSSVDNSGFSSVVKDYTGLNVRLNFVPNDNNLEAFATLPTFDLNHPFLRLNIPANKVMGASDSMAVLKTLGDKIKGGIDKHKCQVSGFYSQIPLDVTISTGYLRSPIFTEEHIAAILIHEIGHLFTYFEYIGVVAFGSMVIAETSRQLLEVNSIEARMDIITYADDLLGVERHLPDDLDKMANNAETAHVILLRNYVAQTYTTGRFPVYDVRNVEQLADIFTVKHGAGRAMASAIQSIGQATFDTSNQSQAVFLIIGVLTGLNKIIQAIGGPGDAIISFFMSAPGVKIYDSPEDRIKFIRNILANEINEDFKGVDKDQIIKDVQAIDNILKTVKDKRRLIQIFWETIPSPASSRRKQEQAAKEFESILYNDLQYQAALISKTYNNVNN